MAGVISTSPSMGFMNRIKAGMPGAVNAMAQNYGGPFRGLARGVSDVLNRNGNGPFNFRNPNMMPGVPQEGMAPPQPGIVRPPSFMNIPGMRPYMNPMSMGMGMDSGGDAPTGGGLFSVYNNMRKPNMQRSGNIY